MGERTTFCRICEAACGLSVLDGPDGIKLAPDRAHPVSRGYVCAKGTRFAEVARSPARRIHATRGAETASMNAALDDAASRIGAVVERHGPHAVGLYLGNPLAFNALGQVTAMYLARAIGTRNVYSAGSQDCTNKFTAAELLYGTPVIHPIPDFARARTAVLFGTNPLVSQSSFVHLEGGATTFDRMRERGARIVWVDVRETESAQRWGELVRVRPGSDVWLILALLARAARGATFDDPRVTGLASLLALAERASEQASARTGLSERAIDELLDAIREGPTALHMSVGVNQGPFGTLSYVALQALSYVTGNYDVEGGVLFSEAAIAGARFARSVGLFTSDAKSRIGGFGLSLETLPAGILAEEILTPGPDRIRAMIVVAGDPLRSIPGSPRLEEAFASLETIVSLDLFESATTRRSHVFLPCTSWLERSDFALPGLPLTSHDLLPASHPVMPAPGDARPEHELLAELSLRIGRPVYGSALVAKAFARPGLATGMLSSALRLVGALQPDPARRTRGIPLPIPRPGRFLGRGPMTEGGAVRFFDPRLAQEGERLMSSPPPRDGLALVGRRRRIGHNSWLHAGARFADERDAPDEAVASVHPDDARRVGLTDGAPATIRTSQGSLTLRVRFDERVAAGTVVVPHGVWRGNVNALLPYGVEHMEPLSGMLHMTGVPVELLRVEAERTAHDAALT
ncbi:MAG: molybdopterin-dependent oxidoreductase [Sandaracinaceae bacterium]